MKIQSTWCCLVFAMGASVVAGAGMKAQTGSLAKQEAPDSKEQQALIRSVDGPELYRTYCASCHGKDGKGNGPAASALKATVPDLTVIARDNKGEFPVARVRRIVMGEGIIASHGSREMPVWGPIFHQVETDVDRGYVRLDSLVKYLQSIQSIPTHKTKDNPPAGNLSSGAQLYKQLCAACHGNDLKGNGPAPAPFKDVPPDLTTLARRRGGTFPDAYVSNVLRNGVPLHEHGPAEMPIWGTDFVVGNRLDEIQVTLRITNLSNYIKAHQAN
jgi:mono/diheme cytochrome c family protein